MNCWRPCRTRPTGPTCPTIKTPNFHDQIKMKKNALSTRTAIEGKLMTDIHQPHDKFFKRLFSRPEVARDFIENYLPENVLRRLDLDSLQLMKDTFVDAKLRGRFSDVLCRVRLANGKEAYVYVLFEHKSSPYRLVAFQLLKYMVGIWEAAIDAYEEKKAKGEDGESSPFFLPPIIPIVVYHGKTGWNVSNSFSALFESFPGLGDHIPDFRFAVHDLTGYADEDIKGMVVLRVGLLVMKYIFKEELGERLPEILGLLRELSKKRSGLEYLETVVLYLLSAAESLTRKQIGQAVEKAAPEKGGEMMATLAEQWLEEGRLEGERKGKKETLLKTLETGLKRKFGSEGSLFFMQIRKSEELELLESIQERLLWTDDGLDELRRMLR